MSSSSTMLREEIVRMEPERFSHLVSSDTSLCDAAASFASSSCSSSEASEMLCSSRAYRLGNGRDFVVQWNLGRMITITFITFKRFAVCSSVLLHLVDFNLCHLVFLLLLQALAALAASHGGNLSAERGESRGLEGRRDLSIEKVLARVFELVFICRNTQST
eukprot:765889-Hanusia_phi.AAC.1